MTDGCKRYAAHCDGVSARLREVLAELDAADALETYLDEDSDRPARLAALRSARARAEEAAFWISKARERW